MSPHLLRSTALLGASALCVPLMLVPAQAQTVSASDIDGDGYADLFVGAPEGIGGNDVRGGYVAVVPGSPDGADPEAGYQIDQDSPGVPGAPEVGDRFGEQVASADLNGDGHADLVVSAPEEDVGEYEDAGLVQVVFGSEDGLSQDAIGLHSPRQERGDTGFGTHLATGDLDGDGLEDVAISNGDHISVLWGREDLDEADDPSVTSFLAAAGPGDEVEGLAMADVSGNGVDDLIVTSAHDEGPDLGDLLVFSGTEAGSDPVRIGEPVLLPEGASDVAAGDIDGDGHADVVLTPADGDAARVFAGSADGITEDGTTLDEGLGTDSVAIGDIDDDGHADIVLGDTTVEDPDGGDDAGGVSVVHGGPDWTDGRQESFVQGSDGVDGVSEAGDRMGADVSLIDLDGDGMLDLVAGVPGENDGNGAITIIYNSDEGLSGEGSQTFGAATMGLDGTEAEFGAALP
ncbi:FG-GAP repeat protein [Nocardiopsis sp. HNM0947]|uniref:FG-GAP repeat protein n=1 Tax=Nocardiopsis coralli TaxID=2772213 RepID=A0ABR9P3J5_9ACTN|nr:FG-GAP-like repeat-containing protein [Nocardiopsis coralli]MBE2998421.1 FG-GAP repeat protein [Nocardiopsis coralli]